MARAVGLGSQFRGKLGNMVGYLTKNRRGRLVQSVKVYQPVVSNPQTMSQALARVPLGPIQRFYSQLSTFIERGFEGIAYGDNAKNEFLSYNMRYFKGPYLQKGEVTPYPGPFLVTKGSLGSYTVLFWDKRLRLIFAVCSIAMDSNISPVDMGDVSQSILNANPNMKKGEQLTFVSCVKMNGQVTYQAYSFLLDPTSTADMDYFSMYNDSEGTHLGFLVDTRGSFDNVLGACIIRSAPYGEAGFRRSTSYFQIREGAMPYFDDNAMKAAILSYRTDPDGSEDWEDDPMPAYQAIAYIMMVNITEDMVFFPSMEALAGKQCLGYVTKGAQTGIFYAWNDELSQWQVLDGYAKFLFVEYSGQETPVRYNGTYEPALVYDPSYGRIYGQ